MPRASAKPAGGGARQVAGGATGGWRSQAASMRPAAGPAPPPTRGSANSKQCASALQGRGRQARTLAAAASQRTHVAAGVHRRGLLGHARVLLDERRQARTHPARLPAAALHASSRVRGGGGGVANSLAHPQATWVRGDQTRPSCRTQASAHVYGRQATREGRMASPPAAPQPPALSPAAPAAPAAPATHGALAT